MAKNSYAKMFTKRKDGYYQKKVNGKVLYDKDPEVLFEKWQAALKPHVPTVLEAGEIWKEKKEPKLGQKTWLSYKPQYQRLMDEFGEVPVTDLTASMIDKMLQRSKLQGYSRTIIGTRFTILNQIMNEALLQDWIKYNPVRSLSIPKSLKRNTRKAPSENEIKKIVSNADSDFGFIVFFLLCTGMRRGEALALTLDDIDLTKNEIRISKALSFVSNSNPIVKEPKNEFSNRVIPIIEVLRPRLKKYIRGLKSDILFPDFKYPDRYMNEKSFTDHMHRYCKETGVNITAHMLRHGTATLLYESGVDVYTTRAILGHSNINTTMEIYTNLREEQKKKSLEKLSGVLKGV